MKLSLAKCSGKEPACHCSTPTPWTSRRFDGPWFDDGVVIGYQRTCTKCRASKTIDAKDAPREDRLAHVRQAVGS